MKTYRVISPFHLGGDCPPPLALWIFNPSDIHGVEMSSNGYSFLVQVPEGTPPPADLGPLVRVEEIPPQA